MNLYFLKNSAGKYLTKKGTLGDKDSAMIFTTNKEAEKERKRHNKLGFFVAKEKRDITVLEEPADTELLDYADINPPLPYSYSLPEDFMADILQETGDIPLSEEVKQYTKEEYIEAIRTMIDLVKNHTKRKQYLSGQVSSIDQMQQDILHDIEFSKTCELQDGYAFYEELKNVREERRRIKDAFCLEQMLDHFCNVLGDFPKTATKFLDNFEHRVYTPRQRGEK